MGDVAAGIGAEGGGEGRGGVEMLAKEEVSMVESYGVDLD